jgi:ABC-type multidrug transport system fused ATPase/permease subunit
MNHQNGKKSYWRRTAVRFAGPSHCQRHESIESFTSINSLNDEQFNKIKKLANNLNKSLEHYKSLEEFAPSKSNFSDSETDNETEIDLELDTKINKNKNNNDKPLSETIIKILKEYIFLTLFYVLLSQEFIKIGINNYIPQLSDYKLIETIVYGLILSTLYIFFNKIFL